MPLYDYECANCGVIFDVWAKIHETELVCEKCKGEMVRLISRANISPDYQPYFDENLASPGGEGTYIKSRQHRKEVMQRLGFTDGYINASPQRWI